MWSHFKTYACHWTGIIIYYLYWGCFDIPVWDEGPIVLFIGWLSIEKAIKALMKLRVNRALPLATVVDDWGFLFECFSFFVVHFRLYMRSMSLGPEASS